LEKNLPEFGKITPVFPTVWKIKWLPDHPASKVWVAHSPGNLQFLTFSFKGVRFAHGSFDPRAAELEYGPD